MSEYSKLCELRERIINALGDNEYNVGVLMNTEENHISIVYHGHKVCKIDDTISANMAIRVMFENDFYDTDLDFPRLKHCADTARIAYYINQRIAYYNNKKGQENMVSLLDLRDYILQEIGNLVTATCDPCVGQYKKYDRIIIKYDSCWVCSIYRNKDNIDLFDIIFYDPFVCRREGYSPSVSLTVTEIPKAIKNRIDICDGINHNQINVNVSNNTVAKEICMMSARGSGKTRWVSEMFKNSFPFKDHIKDVIFNDPATIVFWTDGSKTVVKCQPGETFDPEKGLAMAISKKVLGNDYGYYETFAKHVGRYNKKRFNKALEEAKKIPPDEITYNGETYVLKNKEK